MQAARRLESRLRLAQPVGQGCDDRQRQLQLGFDPRRLDRDRFQRALSADAAGGGGVEAALQTRGIEAGGIDLDPIRGEIVGQTRLTRLQPLGQTEAERELLVVSRRPHRDGDGPPRDPDLERLLDGYPVALGRAGRKPEDVDRCGRVGRRVHQRTQRNGAVRLLPYQRRRDRRRRWRGS